MNKSRQLVLLLDGTGNTLTGDANDTNISKLFTLLVGTGSGRHVLYYSPGVGAPEKVRTSGPIGWAFDIVRRLPGLAAGDGVLADIAQAYAFVVRTYQPDDQIFIFGFSRGAFTARCVASLINLYGLIRPEHEGLVARLLCVYFSRQVDARRAIVVQMRQLLTPAFSREVAIDFLGVWDTVVTVGIPGAKLVAPGSPLVTGRRIRHVRHALALDEYRDKYRPWLFAEKNFGRAEDEQSLHQIWFPGAHCDVGGGYPLRESGLSNETLEWMVTEARMCGLVCDPFDAVAQKARRVKHDELHANFLWGISGMSNRSYIKPTTGEFSERVLHGTAGRPMDDWVWSHRRRRTWALCLLGLVILASVVDAAQVSEVNAMHFAALGLIPMTSGMRSPTLILFLLFYTVYLSMSFAALTWAFARVPSSRMSRIYSGLGRAAGSAVIMLIVCVLSLVFSISTSGWLSEALFRLAGWLSLISGFGAMALLALLVIGPVHMLAVMLSARRPTRR